MHWAQLSGEGRERLWERRRRKRSSLSERNTNKVQHSRKSSGEKTLVLQKLPLNLIQYCGISVFSSPRVCVHQLCAGIYVSMCVKCAHRHAKTQSYRTLHLRYSYALGEFGHSIRSRFSFFKVCMRVSSRRHVCVGFFERSEQEGEIALAWLKGQ